MSDEITLRAMRFQALVGILPHELTTPQPIEIDVTVNVDRGEDVLDYRRLYDAAAQIVDSGHIGYLEDIAERVAASTFATSERVSRVRVAVRKPHVALGGPLAYAEVKIERARTTSGV
jgi:7,8-dihydroneopterin aldolase/epimerase/oxygenase